MVQEIVIKMIYIIYLSVGGSGKAYASAENFYEDLGDIAMDKG